MEAFATPTTRATGALAISALCIISGCSRSFTEGQYSIDGAPGFFFFDAGGNETAILFEKPGKKAVILIDARVDSYIVEKGTIHVARSPRTVEANEHGQLIGRIAPNCEFWSIDIKEGTRRPETDGRHGVRCRGDSASPAAYIAR